MNENEFDTFLDQIQYLDAVQTQSTLEELLHRMSNWQLDNDPAWVQARVHLRNAIAAIKTRRGN